MEETEKETQDGIVSNLWKELDRNCKVNRESMEKTGNGIRRNQARDKKEHTVEIGKESLNIRNLKGIGHIL